MKIEIKNKLNIDEVEQVFKLYIDSYYERSEYELTEHELKFVKESIQSPIFTWYLLKNDEIIGIGSFVNECNQDKSKNQSETNLSVHPLDINYELKENVTNIAISALYKGKGYCKLLMNEIISNTNCDLVLEIKKNSGYFDQLMYVYKSVKFVEYAETETGVFLRRKRLGYL